MKPLVHHITQRQLNAAQRDVTGGYIFHGVRSIGKAASARELARALNCRGDEVHTCLPCRQLAAGSYPDYIEIAPESRPSITIDQVRQLGHSLSLSPYYAEGTRMVVVDEAHMLTIEAQNALLKLIEEPPPRTVFVLVAEHMEALLPTVISRLVALYFAPVPAATLSDWLTANHSVAVAEADRLSHLADGAPGVAVRLLQDTAAADQLAELDKAAREALSSGLFDRLILAKSLSDKKVDLPAWALRLQQALLGGLRLGQLEAAETAGRLVAVERFRRNLVANVGSRVALERLMLEL